VWYLLLRRGKIIFLIIINLFCLNVFSLQLFFRWSYFLQCDQIFFPKRFTRMASWAPALAVGLLPEILILFQLRLAALFCLSIFTSSLQIQRVLRDGNRQQFWCRKSWVWIRFKRACNFHISNLFSRATWGLQFVVSFSVIDMASFASVKAYS
jgi:hypothetical protein